MRKSEQMPSAGRVPSARTPQAGSTRAGGTPPDGGQGSGNPDQINLTDGTELENLSEEKNECEGEGDVCNISELSEKNEKIEKNEEEEIDTPE